MFLYQEKDLDNTMLYHYTTPEGLLGILQKEEVNLHFTKFTALNDKMEGKVLQKRFLAICERLYREKVIDKREIDNLLEYVNFETGIFRCFLDGKWQELNFEDTFVCSFSLQQDSLPMWNYYVKNGGYQGYNIGFRNPYFCCDVPEDDINQNILQICQVLYSDKELEVLVRESQDILKKCGEDLTNLLHDLHYGVLQHKESCFAHEQEVRLIYTANPKKKKQIKYKVKNGVLVPYIEVKLMRETVQEITVGPLIEQDLAVKNLREFLEQRGYPDVDIKVSEIPIRY